MALFVFLQHIAVPSGLYTPVILPILGVTGITLILVLIRATTQQAAIAQLGERQTEDLKVPGSIPGLGMAVWSLVNKLRVFSTGNGSTMWHAAGTFAAP